MAIGGTGKTENVRRTSSKCEKSGAPSTNKRLTGSQLSIRQTTGGKVINYQIRGYNGRLSRKEIKKIKIQRNNPRYGSRNC
ncbi:MAG: hypothetical protein AB1394_10330, partial [Bacteroidota bacterium]